MYYREEKLFLSHFDTLIEVFEKDYQLNAVALQSALMQFQAHKISFDMLIGQFVGWVGCASAIGLLDELERVEMLAEINRLHCRNGAYVFGVIDPAKLPVLA